MANSSSEPLIGARNQAVGKGWQSNPRAKAIGGFNLRRGSGLRESSALAVEGVFCQCGRKDALITRVADLELSD